MVFQQITCRSNAAILRYFGHLAAAGCEIKIKRPLAGFPEGLIGQPLWFFGFYLAGRGSQQPEQAQHGCIGAASYLPKDHYGWFTACCDIQPASTGFSNRPALRDLALESSG
jgi:hypothetical protein